MIIKLDLREDVILLTSNLLQNVYTENFELKDFQEKVAFSIGFNLADKFQTKAKNIIKKRNLLNSNATHRVTLKYHEAWSLHFIIKQYELNMCNYRDEVKIGNLASIIHQKIS